MGDDADAAFEALDELRKAAAITQRLRQENRDLLAQVEDYAQKGDDLRQEIQDVAASDDGSSDEEYNEDPMVVKKENDALRKEISRLIVQRERREALFEDTEMQVRQLHQCTIDGHSTDDALIKQSYRNEEFLAETENLKATFEQMQESNWELRRELKRAQQNIARKRDDAGLENVGVRKLSEKQRLMEFVEAQAQEIADAEDEIAALEGSCELLKQNIEDVAAKISDFRNDEKEQMAERLAAQITQTRKHLSDRELVISDLQVKLAREINAISVLDEGNELSATNLLASPSTRIRGVNLLAEFKEIEQKEAMNALSLAKESLMDELDFLDKIGANSDVPEDQERVLSESLEHAHKQVDTLRTEKEKILTAIADARRAWRAEEEEKTNQINELRETCNERAATLETLLVKVGATEKAMDDAEENSSFLTNRMAKAHRLLMNKLKAEHTNDGHRHNDHAASLEKRIDALTMQLVDDPMSSVDGDATIATLEKNICKQQLHWDEMELNDAENALKLGARKSCIEFFHNQAMEALKACREKLENEQEAARVNDKKMMEEMKAAKEERLQDFMRLISNKRVLLDNKKAMEAAIAECHSALWRLSLSPLGRKRKNMLGQIDAHIRCGASGIQPSFNSFAQTYFSDSRPSSGLTNAVRFMTLKSDGVPNAISNTGKYNSRSRVARTGKLAFAFMLKRASQLPELGAKAVSDACDSTLRTMLARLVESLEPTVMPVFSIDDVVTLGNDVQVSISLESYDSKKKLHERALCKVVSSRKFIGGVNKKCDAKFDTVVALGDPVFEPQLVENPAESPRWKGKENGAAETMCGRGCAVSDPVLGEGMLLNVWEQTCLVDWGHQTSEVPLLSLTMLPEVVTSLNISVNEIVCRRTSVSIMGIVKRVSKASVKVAWDDDISIEEEVFVHNVDQFTLRFPENWERNAYLAKQQCASASNEAYCRSAERGLPAMKYKPDAELAISSPKTISSEQGSASPKNTGWASLVGSPAEAFVREEMKKLVAEEKRLFSTVNQTTRDKTYMRKQLNTFKKQIQMLQEQQQVTCAKARAARARLREELGQQMEASHGMCWGPRERRQNNLATISILDRAADPPDSEDEYLHLISAKASRGFGKTSFSSSPRQSHFSSRLKTG